MRTADPKMRVVTAALRLRRDRPDTFTDGGYTPLLAEGAAAEHLVAFLRADDVVTAVTRHSVVLAETRWGDTSLTLPDGVWADRIAGGRFSGSGVGVGSVRRVRRSRCWSVSMVEFAVWAPRPDVVRLDVDGTLYPMDRSDDGWWRADVEARPDARYGFVLDDDPKVLPDPRSPRQPDGVHERSQLWRPAPDAWTDRRLAGPIDRGPGHLRVARRHVHAGRHVRLGDREAGLSGRFGRRLRRADAGQRVRRDTRLGLRRRALVCGARAVRRARRTRPFDQRLPPARPGRADRCGVQSSWPVGQLPAAVRAVPVVGQQPVGRIDQHLRRGRRRGAPLHHRLRAALDA